MSPPHARGSAAIKSGNIINIRFTALQCKTARPPQRVVSLLFPSPHARQIPFAFFQPSKGDTGKPSMCFFSANPPAAIEGTASILPLIPIRGPILRHKQAALGSRAPGRRPSGGRRTTGRTGPDRCRRPRGAWCGEVRCPSQGKRVAVHLGGEAPEKKRVGFTSGPG
jgi:hypothetical protein